MTRIFSYKMNVLIQAQVCKVLANADAICVSWSFNTVAPIKFSFLTIFRIKV